MQLDDELCLCFHVTQRKVINFIRVERPARVGQLSECFGAGTGCGWCRPYLRKLFETYKGTDPTDAVPEPATELTPSAEDYAQGRSSYVKAGKGTPPPGATPVE